MYVVHVGETDPPEGIEGVDWLVLTTAPVTSLKDAVEKIDWYTLRWRIERFHYALKSGCRIEELYFETMNRLKKAIALYSLVAWRIPWLTYQARETPKASCAVILRRYEWQALYCMTNKTPILFETLFTLQQAVRLIGKLGDICGARKCDGMRRVKMLWRGLPRLKDISETWLLMSLTHVFPINMGKA